MIANLLTQFRGWLSSKTVSWFAPYWEAKRLHERSPHGLFTKGKGLYRALTPADIESAAHCPRLARAIELYRECVDRERSAGRVFNHGMALHQLGLVWHRQGKIEKAQRAYEEALAILEDLPQGEALLASSTCHFRLAEVFLQSGDRKAAGEHLERSRSIDKSVNDRAGLAMSKELERLIKA